MDSEEIIGVHIHRVHSFAPTSGTGNGHLAYSPDELAAFAEECQDHSVSVHLRTIRQPIETMLIHLQRERALLWFGSAFGSGTISRTTWICPDISWISPAEEAPCGNSVWRYWLTHERICGQAAGHWRKPNEKRLRPSFCQMSLHRSKLVTYAYARLLYPCFPPVIHAVKCPSSRIYLDIKDISFEWGSQIEWGSQYYLLCYPFCNPQQHAYFQHCGCVAVHSNLLSCIKLATDCCQI